MQAGSGDDAGDRARDQAAWNESGEIRERLASRYTPSALTHPTRCAEKNLHRYLAEFDFRHNSRICLGVDDIARADRVLGGIIGKRLTYQTTQKR
jgi:hypothetical protein